MNEKEIYIRTEDVDWQPANGYPSGALQKVLYVGSDSQPKSFLLKIEPGWLMNEHAHIHHELHYVLEGEYESKDKVYPEGSFRLIPAHSSHGPFTTIRGAVVLVVRLSEL
jgi:anti-sigma factor ChrR (cupin superfamily)